MNSSVEDSVGKIIENIYPGADIWLDSFFIMRNALYWPGEKVGVSAKLMVVTDSGYIKELSVRVVRRKDYYFCIMEQCSCYIDENFVILREKDRHNMLSYVSMECVWTISTKGDDGEDVLEHIYVHRGLNWYFPLTGDSRFFVLNTLATPSAVWICGEPGYISQQKMDVVVGYDKTGASYFYKGRKEDLSDAVEELIDKHGLVSPALSDQGVKVYSRESKLVAMQQCELRHVLGDFPGKHLQ